ncbi:acyltransferase family protein [Aliiglaciecola litoralis]|uniref:Acyltransferase family protein n=1 Tax=Aliiglaciecola litoralis TaxID=582857 RepID=A0ABP3WN72_9ALTE
MLEIQDSRRYDVDWLRTLAFLLLILYHIGMYYVQDWGWHIKSEHTFAWLQELMILTNRWRMSLLFFISAMALSLVVKRYSNMTLLKLRTNRLLVPLIFGMFVIVFPQVYVEAISQNLITPGVLSFWLEYINPNTSLLRDHHSPIGLLTWNHLWFLPYLWVYSVIVILSHQVLDRFIASIGPRIPFAVMFGLLCLALIGCWYWLAQSYPVTHALVDDWYNHSKYFLVFITGYTFARVDTWWQYVIAKRSWLLGIALLGYSFIVADRNGGFPWLAAQYEDSFAVQMLYGIFFTANHWAWIFALIGFAGAYLTKPTPFLLYANKAILPWYMFHQTVIIVVAWNLKEFALPAAIEFPLILGSTVLTCLIGYEIVRRTPLTRWLFGLKQQNKRGF